LYIKDYELLINSSIVPPKKRQRKGVFNSIDISGIERGRFRETDRTNSMQPVTLSQSSVESVNQRNSTDLGSF
jgi:hypothetical protein